QRKERKMDEAGAIVLVSLTLIAIASAILGLMLEIHQRGSKMDGVAPDVEGKEDGKTNSSADNCPSGSVGSAGRQDDAYLDMNDAERVEEDGSSDGDICNPGRNADRGRGDNHNPFGDRDSEAITPDAERIAGLVNSARHTSHNL